MANLGTHYHIGDTLTIPFQTRSSTGALADADAVPAYRIYEEGGTTAVTSGNGAKRDDANTTGYYEASVSLLAATGFEVGKSYSVYKSATIGGVDVGALDTFAITSAGSFAPSAITGYPAVADIEGRLDEMGIAHPADATTQAIINAVIRTWENLTGYKPFLNADSTSYTKEFRPIHNGAKGCYLVDFQNGLLAVPTTLKVSGYYDSDGAYTGGSTLVVNRDYNLLPENAEDESKPWTRAEIFYSYMDTQSKNVQIVAPFGYATSLPDDVWNAILEEVVERVSRLSSGGQDVKKLKQGPVEWEYVTSEDRAYSTLMGITLCGYKRSGKGIA